MTNRQYVACKFRPEDRRCYTYHNDGEPVAEGDAVRVPDRYGDGWKAVIVAYVTREAPDFPTKAIIGKHVEVPAAPQEQEI